MGSTDLPSKGVSLLPTMNSEEAIKGSQSPELIERDVDKVNVSRAVADDGARDLDMRDLRDRLSEIVKMINRANT
jgi:hypothetical protein